MVAKDKDRLVFFENLSKIALRILTLPSTEAICERVFSQLKLIHNHLRIVLKSEVLDALLNIKLKLPCEKEYEITYSEIEEDENEDSEEEDEEKYAQ